MTDVNIIRELNELHREVALFTPVYGTDALRQKIRHLAASLTIDLDEAKRVWRKCEPSGRSGQLDILAEILAMHADISEAGQIAKRGFGVEVDDGKPSGFPICLARLYLQAEELETAVKR